jgi:hypothetical protein
MFLDAGFPYRQNHIAPTIDGIVLLRVFLALFERSDVCAKFCEVVKGFES